MPYYALIIEEKILHGTATIPFGKGQAKIIAIFSRHLSHQKIL
jgi:hypothetical protein